MDGRVVDFSHRWEATLLALLALRLEEGENRSLELTEFQEHIVRLGQRRPLDRTGMRRLLYSLKAGIDEVLGEGSFAARVRTEPRRETVGPYRLLALPGDRWDLAPSRATLRQCSRPAAGDPAPAAGEATAAPPAMRLTTCNTSAAARGVVQHFMVADDMFRQGRFAASLEELEPLAGQDGVSADCRALALLRMVLAHKRLRRWRPARALLGEVERMARHGCLGDEGLACRAEYLATRILYDTNGSDNARLALARLDVAQRPRAGGDALKWELHNLRAMAEFSLLLEAASGPGIPPDGEWPALPGWGEFMAGLYWALAAHSHEGVQHLCANIGANLQELFRAGRLPRRDAGEIFGWYTLALAYAERFSLGEDSAWERIWLGNLWLRCPDLREDLRRMGHLVIGSRLPHEAAFHVDTVKRADELGDLRQLALAVHNAWCFGREAGLKEMEAQYASRLRLLLRSRKALRLQMRQEGYEV